MPERYSSSPFIPPAASTSGGGCLSGFLLPPLAVLGVGAILAFFALGPFNSPASAETPDRVNETPLDVMGSSISPIFTPEVQYWSKGILIWSAAAGVEPNLAATVMQIESCGDPLARSGAGAIGLFQVMPYHFPTGEYPYSPDTNALRGLDYLRRSLEAARGDPRLALAGYNGGIGVIGQPEFSWSEETRTYAAYGSGIYQDAAGGTGTSSHLQEWLAVRGTSLCRQAHARLGITP